MKGYLKLTCLLAAICVGTSLIGAEKQKQPEKQKCERSCAKMTVFQWGIFPPVQLFGEKTDVYGLRLSTIYSNNKDVHGLDTGVCTGSKNFGGVQVAVANFNEGTATGIQLGLLNATYKDMFGFQAGAVNLAGSEDFLYSGKVKGVQAGYVNICKSDAGGAQIGLANFSSFNFCGIQLGFVNFNDNDAAKEKSTCLQIGAFNFNKDGFLPFFPVINF